VLEQAMVEYLRSMDKATIRNLQNGLRDVRSKFLYMPLPGKEGIRSVTASHLLLNEMSKRADMLNAELGPPLASSLLAPLVQLT
jgi:hypothetical protein